MPGFTTKDVVFHTPPQGPLEATLYLPEGDGPFPAVVSVHGGGWSGETRRANVIFDQAMAAAGIVVMAVDFRMPPACRYPVSVGDINLAIRWLKLEAPVLDIVPGLVGGFGTSSGGHQIFLNALCPDDPLYAAEELPGGHMILERGAAAQLPPALVIQGTADQSLTPDMASRFAAAYHAAGGALELVIFDGQPHSFVAQAQAPESEDAKRAVETVIGFVKRQGKEDVLF